MHDGLRKQLGNESVCVRGAVKSEPELLFPRSVLTAFSSPFGEASEVGSYAVPPRVELDASEVRVRAWIRKREPFRSPDLGPLPPRGLDLRSGYYLILYYMKLYHSIYHYIIYGYIVYHYIIYYYIIYYYIIYDYIVL